MRQTYHTIIQRRGTNLWVGWVEEVQGTVTFGHTLAECRVKLRESLRLMVETMRDEARLCADDSCIMEPMEVEVADDAPALVYA
jgi:predicted RNase H-like HicB family nuclease